MYLAIDSDYLVYSCGFAFEGQPLNFALQGVKTKLNRYIRDTERAFACDVKYEVFLSPSKTFRDRLTDTYKANRKDTKKPTHYKDIREYLINSWNAQIPEDIEADDIVGIEHMKRWSQDPMGSCIAASDKDLWTIPGWHYNTYAGGGKVPEKYHYEYIDRFTADLNLYTQMLTGDTVDNIKGVPGIGGKTAAKLLTGVKSKDDMIEVVKKTYKDKFDDKWEEEYNLNYRLLYILQEKVQP